MFRSADQRAVFFGGLSIIVIILTLLLAWNYKRKRSPAERPFPIWRVITVGVYIAMVLQYIPILHVEAVKGNLLLRCLGTAALSFAEALRVFAIDGDFQKVQNGVQCIQNADLRLAYTVTAYVGFVVAPVLTGGFVLSFFTGLFANIRYFFCGKRPTMIFSKLNAQSIALAKSIREAEAEARSESKKPWKVPSSVIVFADVFYENNDDDYTLLCSAKEIGALCLKRDITHLSLGKKNKVKMFVIGDDESENLAQAIALTEEYKGRHGTSIYVYATSIGSGYIMDSLKKGDLLLPDKLKKQIAAADYNRVEKAIGDGITENKWYPTDEGFNITRVDSVYNLVLDTFCNSNVFQLCNATRTDKVISLLIVGMGEYGKQILKTALWYCQMDGYKLEINVVDSGKDKNGVLRDIEEVLRQECPEVITKNPSRQDGDAYYDLHFYKNIDCFSAAFDDLFKNPVPKERIKRTLMAFVALGNDDKNIQVAVMLRRLFDRLHGNDADFCKEVKTNPEKDLPVIYAVVYDDQKARNLNVNAQTEKTAVAGTVTEKTAEKEAEDDSFLVDHKENPFHIHFIGNLSSHYSYAGLLKMAETEWKAFKYHMYWVNIEKTIRQGISEAGIEMYAENASLLQEILQQEKVSDASKIEWDDLYLRREKEEDERDVLSGALIGDIEKYMRFEYYRYSSIAKACHKEMLEDVFGEEKRCETQKPKEGKNPLCRCSACEWRRKSEHMRWNAYMRSVGFRFGEPRVDRAYVHDCLRPWKELPWRTRFKD